MRVSEGAAVLGSHRGMLRRAQTRVLDAKGGCRNWSRLGARVATTSLPLQPRGDGDEDPTGKADLPVVQPEPPRSSQSQTPASR
jgi:hypothetical protein